MALDIDRCCAAATPRQVSLTLDFWKAKDRSIVVSKLGDMDGIFGYAVDEAVLIVDAARPVARKRVFQGLGLSNALKRAAFCLFNERVDASEDFSIGFLPEQIVVPGVI